MQKNIDGILLRLSKLALSAVVLFFFTTALILASVRLWLGPELIKTLNNPQKLETLLSRFDLSKEIDLTVVGADLAWEKWLIPELKLSMVTVSDKEEKFNLAVFENLKIGLGITSLATLLEGEIVFDRVSLESLKIYLASNQHEKPTNFKIGNPEGTQKFLLGLFKLTRQAYIEETQIFEVSKTKFWRQKLLLRIGRTDLQYLDNGTSLSLQKIDSSELFGVLNFLNLPLKDIYGYTINGTFDKINVSFGGKDLSSYEDFNTEIFLNGLGIEGKFSSLTIKSHEKNFYLDNISGDFNVEEGLINLKVVGSETNLEIPNLFPTGKFYFSGFSGEIKNSDFSFYKLDKWRSSEPVFKIKNLEFDNPDLTLMANGNVTLLKTDIFTKVSGDLLFKDPQVVSRYLPKKVGPKTRDWISKAFISGEEINGSFIYHGIIGKPELKKNRRVKFNFSPTDLDLLFSKRWPAIFNLSGEVEIEGRALLVRNASGVIGGSRFKNVSGQILNMKSDNPVLKLTGVLKGDLQGIIDSANKSPVKRWLKNFTDDMTGKGSADLDLFLTIDLKNFKKSDVFGKMSFENNEVSVKDFLPNLSIREGEIIFSKNKLVNLEIEGTSLGQGFNIIKRDNNGANDINLTMTGAFDANELVKWLFKIKEPYETNPLKGFLDYKVDIDFTNDTVNVLGFSDLSRLEVEVPNMYLKKTGEKSDLFFKYELKQQDRNKKSDWIFSLESPQEKVELLIQKKRPNITNGSHGADLAPIYKLNIGEQKKNEFDLNNRFKQANTKMLTNVVTISSDKLALDKLYDFLGTQKEIFNFSDRGRLFESTTVVDIASKELIWRDNKFSDFDGIFVVGLDGVSGDIKSEQAAGKIDWYRDTNTVDIDLSKLELRRMLFAENSPSAKLDGNDLSESFTFNLKADEFTNKFGLLGNLKLSVSFEPKLKTWHVRDLSIFSDDFQLYASGFWKIVRDIHSYPMLYGSRNVKDKSSKLTEINFRLETDNIQRLMDKVGYTGLFGQAGGMISGQLAWMGSPLNFKIEDIYGDLYVDILDGKFIRAEPGLGRLIGLFNLQSLSKRLKLDFGDVLSEGFSFDRMRGDVKLVGGVAQTSNLRVLGTQATVFLDGFVDLGEKKQVLRVLVLPNLNAGLASLGYVLVNPAVGLGSFLAQYILRDPLQKILAFEYKISGNLYNPEVEKNSLRSFNQTKQHGNNGLRNSIE